jgi:hypothetical protein
MGMKVLKQRREEMLHEAELNHLKKPLRADCRRPTAFRWSSTVAWDPARVAGVLRKFFQPPKNAD